MDDYISRQSLLKDIENYHVSDGKFQHWVEVQPSAPVREVKRGKWILTEDEDYEYCTCSECGYQNGENWMNGSDIPFCANCGADMREDE